MLRYPRWENIQLYIIHLPEFGKCPGNNYPYIFSKKIIKFHFLGNQSARDKIWLITTMLLFNTTTTTAL